MASIKDFTSNFAKLEKFVGVDFRRWQKKMMFLLTTLSVNYVISSPKPMGSENESLKKTRRSKWENDDFICRGHILNGMQDSLFDIYKYDESAKELRDALENKHMAEDASSKKFLCYRKVASLLRDARHALKHKREEITLSDLGQHIVVESSIRTQENRKDKNPNVGVINMVAKGRPSHSGEKRKKFDTSKGKIVISNTEKVCWECGKPGHRKKNFFVFKNRQKKAKGNGQASTSKDPSTQG